MKFLIFIYKETFDKFFAYPLKNFAESRFDNKNSNFRQRRHSLDDPRGKRLYAKRPRDFAITFFLSKFRFTSKRKIYQIRNLISMFKIFRMEIEETNLSEDIQDEIQSLVAIFEDEISLDIKPDKIILKMAILPCESEVKLIDQEQRVYFELEVLKTDEKSKVLMKKCKGTMIVLLSLHYIINDCLLHLALSGIYPKFSGLSNQRISELESLMKEILEEDGTIYEIIIAARDRLSEMNSSPDGECAICLCCFDNLIGLYKVFFPILLSISLNYCQNTPLRF